MLREFWSILDGGQRRQFCALFAVFIVNGMSEFLSLGAVFALALSLLAPANSSGASGVLNRLLREHLSISSRATPWLATVVIAAFLLKACLGVLTTWLRGRLVHRQRAILSERLLRNYVSRSWPFFLTNNVSVLTSQVTANCSQFALTFLNSAAVIATEVAICAALAAALAIVSPVAMALIALLVGGLLLIVHRLLKSRMRRFGQLYWRARIQANRTAEIALAGAKEVILYRLQDAFCTRIRRDLAVETHAGVLAFTLQEAPRQLIELCAVVAFVGFVGVQAALGYSTGQIALTASVFAAAAFRLLPSISRLSSAAGQLNNIGPAFAMLRPDLSLPPACSEAPAPLPFRTAIELRGLGFRYPEAASFALTDVSVRIPKGSSLAIVGRSGSGKSTLLELLVGLLETKEGEIMIDGARLDPSNLSAWRSKIGYVPQRPFLCDETIANNIAFGVPTDAIDSAQVRRAARLAGIADFVENETRDAYDSQVGDNGVALSGGQRQRLAIARALYRAPEVVVFDEATSALDNITESLVNEGVRQLAGELTVVIVAHRINSVRDCDNILVLDEGRAVQIGGFEELAATEGVFKSMLQAHTSAHARTYSAAS